MSSHFISRGIAAFVAALLVFGSISATAPAFADEPVATPTESSTSAPTATTPTAADPSVQIVNLTGSVAEIDHDHDGGADSSGIELFRIVGQGFLPVDLSDVTVDANGSASIQVQVPASLDLGDTPETKFAALSAYSTENGPLVASNSVFLGSNSFNRGVAAMVNQTPSTTADHKIFALLVTPSNMSGTSASAEQTAAKVANAVAHASSYWSAQSAGKITFALQGTVPWYKSAYSCESSATSSSMWAEAANYAAAQIGYVDAYNTHLVLFFPEAVGTSCGGALGLGTIGQSINTGGILWAAGTDSNIGKSTLSHELGHNLSFGHANWADCNTATPQPGIDGTTGCTINNYGDILDVMGFGISQFSGGTLSSPHAIRGGLWDDSAFAIAAQNTTTSYTLTSINSNAGLRSVVVEDDLGVNYFVEFRNFTGADAQYDQYKANLCSTQYCVPTQSGVRILRLKTNPYGFKGGFGDDAYLIGRTVGGVKRVNYTAGESFSTAGISITVSSVSATTATVSVVRPAGIVSTGASGTPVSVMRTGSTNPSSSAYFPGDVATAFVASTWKADDYYFQWYMWETNARVAIAGETGQSYTIRPSDVGKAFSVVVTGVGGGSPVSVTVPAANFTGYGPISPGTVAPGTATISNASNALSVVTAGWKSGTTFTYQWYRGSIPISGATAQTYTPTQADRGSLLKATVVGAVTGYNNNTVTTAAKDYSVNATGTFAITGTPAVGQVLSLAESLTYSTVDGTPTINSRSYEWLRDGVTISGATASTYTLTSADIGAAITAKLLAGATGYIAYPATTAPTAAVSAAAGSAGVVTISNATDTLTAVPAGWASGTTYTYRWFRGTTAISGATASTYTPTSADRGAPLKVEVTGTTPGYSAVVVTSAAKDYSLTATGTVAITGTPAVGATLTVNDSQTYSTADGTKPIASRTYEWFRDGTAIASATAQTYVPVSADMGKVITARLTSRATGYIPVTATTAATAAITLPSKAPGTVTINSTNTEFAAVTAGWDAGTTFTYQWYRETEVIPGATTAFYTPTTNDRFWALKVQVVGTQPGYLPATVSSPLRDYTTYSTGGAISVSGTATVGSTLTSTNTLTYSSSYGAATVTSRTYQWYDSQNVAISGATSPTYTITGSDVYKQLTLRVTAYISGYMPTTTGSAYTDYVLPGTLTAGTATISNATDALTVVTTGWDSGATLAYQWFRGATAISGATAQTYTPTSIDRGVALKAQVTATKDGYDGASAFTPAKDYSLTATGSVTITGAATNGSTLTIADGQTYTTADGAKTPTKTYEWLRDGTTIATATASTYTLSSADVGKVITAKVTARATGYIALTSTSAATATVAPGTKAAGTVTVSNATDDLTAVPAGWDSGTTYTYKWFRGATAISGATASSYTPTSADRGSALKVEVTGTQPGYVAVAATSAAKDFSLTATGSVTLTGAPSNGSILTIADGQTYTTVDGAKALTKTYEWLRDGTTIASATASTYTVTATDVGKVITAKVTAKATGYIALTSTSAGTTAVVPGTKAAGTVTVSNATDALTAVPAGWDSGTTYTYQWYRGAAAISGATASTYTPISADRGNALKVEITGTQPGYVAVAAMSAAKDYSLTATGTVTITGTASNGSILTIADGQTYTTVDGTKTLTKTYEWLRDGTTIASATASTYTLVQADIGAVITARVTAKATGYIALTSTSAATSTVIVGTKAAGTATIANTTSALTAVTAGWDVGTTFSYQWFRATTAITDATGPTYTPTVSDRDVALKVQVTGTQPGYVAVSAFSPAKDYSLNATGSVTLTGATTVGSTLTVADGQTYTTADGTKTPTGRSYAWYRDGSLIASAEASTYTLVTADLGAVITARLTTAATGYIAWSKLSTATVAITLPAKAPGTVTISNATDALTAVVAGWDSGTTYTYRWLRGATVITGATASSYTPIQADRGNALKVEVTGTQPGYLAAVATSAAKDYSLTATGSATITGTASFGSTLTIADGQVYTTADGSKTVTRTYEWLRDGTTIASATAQTYALTSADIGSVITAKVTARATGYIATTATTAPTAAVALGTKAAGTVTISNSTDDLTAVPAGWDSGTTYTYRWFRGATAISGATSSAYTPTSADRGSALKVEVTGTQPNYVAVAASSAAKDYSLTATGSVTLSGTAANGSSLTITDGQVYTTADGTKPIASRSYEWFRDGTAIASATASTFTLTATDIGSVITAKVTSRATGYIALTTTSAATTAVVPGTKAAGTVTISNTTNTLTAVVAGWDSGTTYTYQWFRGTTAIVGATSSTYTPTVSDRDALLKVQVTGTQPGYVAVAASSAAKDYSLNAAGTLTVSGSATVGSALALVQSLTYTTVDGTATVTGRSYQWYRDGSAIASATGSTYTLVTADLGKVITARIVATATGYIAHTQLSTATTAVTLPSKAPGSATISNTTDVLTVLTAGWDSGTTFTYQWFRGATAITGATSSTYTPTSADRGAALKAEVTGTQPGFLAAATFTPAKDYSLTATGAVTLSGTAANGSTLTIADGQVYTTADGSKPVTKTYAWFRDGTAIASASGATYAVTATDIGAVITAKVTSHATGYIALTSTSAPTTAVIAGTKAAGSATIDNSADELTVVTTGWDAGATFTYQWFRGSAAISGATSSTYTPTVADRGAALKAQVTGTQPGFVAVATFTPAKDYSLVATGTVTLSGDALVGSELSVNDNQTYTTADGSRPIAERNYQWYGDGIVIPFAAASTYTLVTADLGKVITARLTSAATGYIAVSTLSAATTAVDLPTTGAGIATISNGTNVLAVETSGWAEGTTFAYQWYRGSNPISGETTEFYALSSVDRGAELKVKVTGTQPGSLPISIFTPAKDYSLSATGSVTLGGDTTVGSSLYIQDEQEYTTADGPASLSDRTYQWYRDGVALEGATDWWYLLVADDAGSVITARVTSSATGYISIVTLTAPTVAITLPVTPAGYVYVSNATTTLSADAYFWESDTEFAYQWYRGSTPITGATAETYTLTSADRGTTINVEVTGTRPGFLPTAVFSDPRDYSLYLQGDVTFFGDETVGGQLMLWYDLNFVTADGPTWAVNQTFAWYRDGVLIPGETQQWYTLAAADAGKVITATVTGSLTGYIPVTGTATTTGTIKALASNPGYAAISNATDVLTVETSGWNFGTTFTYQWLRGTEEIAGETSATYTPTSADRGFALAVRVTGNQPNYGESTVLTEARDFSLTATGSLDIDGSAIIGSTLSAYDRQSYSAEGSVVHPSVRSYEWKRDGETIANAIDPYYTLGADDVGSTLTVTLTTKLTGYIALQTTSETTATIIGDQPGDEPGTAVISNATDELTVVTEGWDEGTTFTYRWQRYGTAIPGATSQSYTPTSADRGIQLSVRVIATAPGKQPVTVITDAKDYSLNATGLVIVDGVGTVGETLSIAEALEYSTVDGPATPTARSYSWLRDGVVIDGATGDTYLLAADDLDSHITATLTARLTGYIALTEASANSVAVVNDDPTVNLPGTASISNATDQLEVVPAGWNEGTTFAYQWFRGDDEIVGGTTEFYTPGSADRGTTLRVKVTGTLPGFDPIAVYTDAKDFSITADGSLTVSGPAIVGSTLTLTDELVYATADGAPTVRAREYQWLRNGAVIPNATGTSYTLVAADLGKTITATLVARATGYIANSVTTAPTTAVVVSTFATAKVTKSGVVLTAVPEWTGNVPAGTSYSYQWYRGTAAISKATKVTYSIASADLNKEIKVKITAKRSGTTSVARTSTAANYTVTATPKLPTFSGTIAIYQVLTLDSREYTNGGSTTAIQWLRSGKAISGATGATYTIAPADKGKVISVKVTAGAPGFLSTSSTSAATQKVDASAFATVADVTVARTAQPLVLQADAGLGDNAAGAKLAYQWYRDGKAISKATKVTYKLTASDYGKKISVRVVATKATFTPIVRVSASENFSVVATGTITINNTKPARGNELKVTAPQFSNGAVPVYQWYVGGKAVAGATADKFTVPSSAKGKVIAVRVTAAADGYLSYVKSSANTAKVK